MIILNEGGGGGEGKWTHILLLPFRRWDKRVCV